MAGRQFVKLPITARPAHWAGQRPFRPDGAGALRPPPERTLPYVALEMDAKGLTQCSFNSSKLLTPLGKPARAGHNMPMPFTSHMDAALAQARDAGARDEVPVGAVIIAPDGSVVALAGNRTRELNDPTAHAEILAIRAACTTTGSARLVGHDLYVTLEPCAMCAAAISQARIARLYYGVSDPKSGGVAHGSRVYSHPQCHHAPEVYDGIAADEAEALLKGFFEKKR